MRLRLLRRRRKPTAQENRAWVRDRVSRAGLTAETELAALALLDGLGPDAEGSEGQPCQ